MGGPRRWSHKAQYLSGHIVRLTWLWLRSICSLYHVSRAFVRVPLWWVSHIWWFISSKYALTFTDMGKMHIFSWLWFNGTIFPPSMCLSWAQTVSKYSKKSHYFPLALVSFVLFFQPTILNYETCAKYLLFTKTRVRITFEFIKWLLESQSRHKGKYYSRDFSFITPETWQDDIWKMES